MYVKDGIAYAGEPRLPLRVSGVRVLPDYRLWVRFSNGEAKVCDLAPLLDSPAFAPLRDEKRFANVYIDYGMTVWEDGEIDLAPEYLYDHGKSAEKAANA